MKKKYKSIVLLATVNLLASPVITTYAEEILANPKVMIAEGEEKNKEKTVETVSTANLSSSEGTVQTTETSTSEKIKENQEVVTDSSKNGLIKSTDQQVTSSISEKIETSVSEQDSAVEKSESSVNNLTGTSEKTTEIITFDFLGLSNRNFATLQYENNGKLSLTFKGGQAHSGFGTST
ncbi:hypothetical protein IGI47_000810 [Enterococcus sp. AZ191]|uniref:hypothetical protein n=1 Tax=Enterococcus sp. AZ191 TaxID=2774639 RepID=UPI003F205CFF